jgi:hypothetical protein
MATRFYSTVDAVKAETGVEPDHLGYTTDADLTNYIEGRLTAARNIIDNDRERDFGNEYDSGEIEAVPAGIAEIAKEIACNMVIIARIRRASDTVNLSEYDAKVIQSGPITRSITDQLASYKKLSEVEQDEKEDNYRRGTTTLKSSFATYGNYPGEYPIANRDDEWAFDD